jgi:hypothetical protein
MDKNPKCGPKFCSAQTVAEWNKHSCGYGMAQTGLPTMKRNYADEIYIAANLAGKGCTSETVVDGPFVTIGDYTYLGDGCGETYMFPYGPTFGAVSGQVITNRTYWNYGVCLDFPFIADNGDKLDIGGRNGHPGFPLSTINRLLWELSRTAEVMGMHDINTITG